MSRTMLTQSAEPSTRVAIVTGGSRGIGRACADRLVREGFAVVVNYAERQAEAESVVALLKGEETRALAAQADVADERAVAKLFDLTEESFSGVDAVVHAAARQVLAPLVDLDLPLLDELVRTNIRGTFVVDQQAARRVRRGGSIVNFSSSALGRPLLKYTAYAATKGAVEAISLMLANELRGRDINVNAVAPGPTETEMFLEGRDDATLARVKQSSPLERMGTPDDVAELVAFSHEPRRPLGQRTENSSQWRHPVTFKPVGLPLQRVERGKTQVLAARPAKRATSERVARSADLLFPSETGGYRALSVLDSRSAGWPRRSISATR